MIWLVNEPITSLDDLREQMRDRPWILRNARASDIGPLDAARAQLAKIVDSSADGDEVAVVDRINKMLDAHPLRPRIAGHDNTSWHLHVRDTGSAVHDVLVGEALFGLTLMVTQLGPTVLGRCAAPGCNRAFFDTSPNRSRRFCSTRCATRVNVAAHRLRRRAS